MDRGIEALERAGWLKFLTEVQVQTLLAGASYYSKPAETTVFFQGDVDDSVYVILSGRVSVEKMVSSGEVKFVRELGPGRYFGELSVIDPAPRSTGIRTIGRSEFVVFRGASLRSCLEQNGRFCMFFLLTLVRQVRDGDRLLDAREPVGERLWSVLRQLAVLEEQIRPDGSLSLNVSRAILAQRCDADAKTVSRELTRLEQRGLISREGRSIVVQIKALGL